VGEAAEKALPSTARSARAGPSKNLSAGARSGTSAGTRMFLHVDAPSKLLTLKVSILHSSRSKKGRTESPMLQPTDDSDEVDRLLLAPSLSSKDKGKEKERLRRVKLRLIMWWTHRLRGYATVMRSRTGGCVVTFLSVRGIRTMFRVRKHEGSMVELFHGNRFSGMFRAIVALVHWAFTGNGYMTPQVCPIDSISVPFTIT
jgi:hypothetical protein